MMSAGDFRPGSDEVHLWVFSLRSSPEDAGLLGPDEQRRAAAFHFDRDRDRFIAGRAMLRRILGACAGRQPEALSFIEGRSGKPALDGALSFNFSNSDDLGALAVANFELGVDIEKIRVIEEDVAGRFFAADEVARLRALPAERQTEAFFNCWTRKEAYVKAIGDGLLLPLDRFSVSLTPCEPAILLRTDGDPAEPARWRLHHFVPAPGFVGAIAARRPNWHVRLHRAAPGHGLAAASFPA
jgi:4'-phosphopantetheinyl transferase